MGTNFIIDEKNLSKYKYIYLFYTPQGSTELVMERFPVVYINSHYVYFKRNGRPALDYVGSFDKSLYSSYDKEKSMYRAAGGQLAKGYRGHIMYVLAPNKVEAEYMYRLVTGEQEKFAAEQAEKIYNEMKMRMESTIARMKELERLHPELLNQ